MAIKKGKRINIHTIRCESPRQFQVVDTATDPVASQNLDAFNRGHAMEFIRNGNKTLVPFHAVSYITVSDIEVETADKGDPYGCDTEGADCTELINETVTLANGDDGETSTAEAYLDYATNTFPDKVTVVLDGVRYEDVPNITHEGVEDSATYGGEYPTWSGYPFRLILNDNPSSSLMMSDSDAGEHSIAVYVCS